MFCVANTSNSPRCGKARSDEKDVDLSHSILYFVTVSPPFDAGEANDTVSFDPDVTAT
jgi:hypothetical protein